MHQFLAKLWLEPSPAPPHLITFRKLNYSLFRLLIDSSKSLSLYLSVSLSLCHSLSLSLYLFGSLSLCLHQILPINLRLSHLCNICRSAQARSQSVSQPSVYWALFVCLPCLFLTYVHCMRSYIIVFKVYNYKLKQHLSYANTQFSPLFLRQKTRSDQNIQKRCVRTFIKKQATKLCNCRIMEQDSIFF